MIDREIQEHYESGNESQRLNQDMYLPERARTQEIILRYINNKHCKIFDVGGGAGFFSFWLSRLGHEVHLLDPVQAHIDEAKIYSKKTNVALASITLGDARNVPACDNYFDLVLLFGPLYHLTKKNERLLALGEARRVLNKGGICLCVGISRWASLLDGYFRDFVQDPKFVEIMNKDLIDGQHRNPTNNPEYWTTAFFHRPKDLKQEIIESGLKFEKLLAIDSFGWLIPDLGNKFKDPKYRDLLLKSIRSIEDNPSIIGVSAHIMGVATKE